MNRTWYFNYIEEKLNILAYRIETRGKINILDLNIHSETFFADLCNIVFGLNLVNLNSFVQNTEGIDLIDKKNKVVVQVSATCTKTKIEYSLSKEIYKKYNGYDYKFISISKNASDTLKQTIFQNPYTMNFNPLQDIWDVVGILRKVSSDSIDKQRVLYDFISKELGQTVDIVKLDSNIAGIINILAENIDMASIPPETVPFEIEDKIDFNNLQGVQEIIDDYKIFYHKLDQIYSEFDKGGKNKSFSVLQEIRKQYIKLKNTEKSSEEIFYEIIDNLLTIIKNSRNYVEMPIEELQMCVDILVVDAFIRCKIFKNPERSQHVITG